MLGSKSQDFVDEMSKCLLELQALSNGTNGTDNATLASCNSTLLEDIETYVTPLWKSNFLLALIYCCILAVALLVGTFGNILILAISMTTKTMNRVGKHFVINLALADLCVAGVADPMCILGVVKGEKWFQGKWILCELVASMCLTACFCAFLSLTMLTLNRYVFVCRNKIYHAIYKKPVCVFLCVTCWVFAFLFEFPNIIGWGNHYFDDKSHQCIWNRTASLSYTLIVSIVLIGGPLGLMGFCFILIFRKIWLTKKDVFSLNLDDPLRMKKVWIESFRTSRTLAIVFIAFIICWTPYAVVTAVDVHNEYPTGVHLFVTLLAHTHSSLNFTVYMCSNKAFRQDVFSLFRCCVAPLRYRSSSGSVKTTETYRTTDDSTFDNKRYYLNPNSPKGNRHDLKDAIDNKTDTTVNEKQLPNGDNTCDTCKY